MVGNGVNFVNFAQAEIRSLGRAIPARRITNKEWEDLTGAAPEWIISNTGIETRARIGAEESTVDLGLKAAREALGDFDAAALDFVLVATNSQPYLFPSTASLLQKELGAVRATSMDLQAGCTGWLYGLRLATSLIESGQAQSVLVVGTEALTRFLNYHDRNGVLFGDGAGAALVLPGHGGSRLPSPLFATRTRPSLCMQLPSIYQEHLNAMEDYQAGRDMSKVDRPIPTMDGKQALKLALELFDELTGELNEALKSHGLSLRDVDRFVPHQTSTLIIQALCKRLGYPYEEVPLVLPELGGISTACLATGSLAGPAFKKGELILYYSYGAGFTAGAALFEWTV